MAVLIFNDPRKVMAYWDRFENRSIKPVGAYLWRWENKQANRETDEPSSVTPIRREELDMMVLDEDREEIHVDPAVWVQRTNLNNVIILTHENDATGNQPWLPSFLVALGNKIEAENLSKQILGEAALAFSVVE
jgi:hypothetical protein